MRALPPTPPSSRSMSGTTGERAPRGPGAPVSGIGLAPRLALAGRRSRPDADKSGLLGGCCWLLCCCEALPPGTGSELWSMALPMFRPLAAARPPERDMPLFAPCVDEDDDEDEGTAMPLTPFAAADAAAAVVAAAERRARSALGGVLKRLERPLPLAAPPTPPKLAASATPLLPRFRPPLTDRMPRRFISSRRSASRCASRFEAASARCCSILARYRSVPGAPGNLSLDVA